MKAALFVGLVALLAPAVASAQGTAPKAAAGVEDTQCKIVRGPKGRKKYVCKGIVVKGTYHRPHAAYLLSRSKRGYAWSQPRQSLVKRILPTVRRSPF